MVAARRIDILSVPIDVMTGDAVLARIKEFVVSGQPHQIATVNPEFVMEAGRNPEFAEALRTTALNIADGTGIRLAALVRGTPIPETVPGIDLLEHICAAAARLGWRVYFLGETAGVAAETAHVLTERYPGLQVAGAEEGFEKDARVTDTETRALIARIRAAKPDVLFVAFGAPKQDVFIARHRTALGVPVMMGVGGSFNFVTGRAHRAPVLMRRLGLEWLWRLLTQPWRFRRIATATIAFPLAVIRASLD